MSFHMSIRRKLAIATWAAPREGNIYGKMIIDMTNSLRYIDYLREKHQQKVTVTHLVGKAAGMALKECPDLNGRIFLGRYIPFDTVDISFLVSLEGGQNLAKFKVSNVDQKTTAEIAQELRQGSEQLRRGKDADFEKAKTVARLLPTWLIRPILWLSGFLAGSMGVDVKILGLTKFPFGSCIITSVGMFGLDEGYAPPTPFARVPVYLTIPEIKKQPVVRDEQIVIRPLLNIMATIDHRFLDGHRGAMIAKNIRFSMENPWVMDGYEACPFEDESDHIDRLQPFCKNPSDNENPSLGRGIESAS